MKQKQIMVAGSTGYLGRHLVKELQLRGMPFQAMARSDKKLLKLGLNPEQIIKAEVTRPESLTRTLNGTDVVISTVGITRQKEGLSYMDVDYQANMNLLHEARAAGVRKFIYVSALGGESQRQLKIMEAKESFVDQLKLCGLDYAVIRPNGFFSDMGDFLDMAKKGRVYLFGNGEFKLNPIHGADLAQVIVDGIDGAKKEIEVGGPDILTQNEIARLALQAWKRPLKISHIPDWLRRVLLEVLRRFTSPKIYGPYEFFLTMMAQDNIAPRYGMHRLEHYFEQKADLLEEA